MTGDLTTAFQRDGFVVVPKVISAEQVAQLRGVLFGMFDAPAGYEGDFDRRGRLGSVRFDVCSRVPELRWLLTHMPLLSPLRTLLGEDFVFLPEMSAHHGGYGDWHKDTTSQERAGQRFHWEPEYVMVEAALYLQDNSVEYGGGLEVVPGSHTQSDRFLDVIDRTPLDKVRTKLKSWGVLPSKKGTRIPSVAGDLVIFHFRLDHKASSAAETNIPRSNQKLALFFACSRNNHHARRYTDYIASRPDYAFLKSHAYPDELLRVTSAAGAKLMTTRPLPEATRQTEDARVS